MMPSWLSYGGALVTCAVVLFYGARLVLAGLRRTKVSWDAELLHLGMGVAMVAMFDGRFAFLPNPAWLIVFCAGGLWFAWRTLRSARRVLTRQLVGSGLVHVGGCAAMAYMLAVVPNKGGIPDVADLICGIHMSGTQATMAGMGAMDGGTSLTPWSFVALSLGVALLAGVACLARPLTRQRLAAAIRPASEPGGDSSNGFVNATLTSARLLSSAQVAMCLTMTVMLVAMYR